nr:hypothetical protein [Tanacetum cinerariifolium]
NETCVHRVECVMLGCRGCWGFRMCCALQGHRGSRRGAAHVTLRIVAECAGVLAIFGTSL